MSYLVVLDAVWSECLGCFGVNTDAILNFIPLSTYLTFPIISPIPQTKGTHLQTSIILQIEAIHTTETLSWINRIISITKWYCNLSRNNLAISLTEVESLPTRCTQTGLWVILIARGIDPQAIMVLIEEVTFFAGLAAALGLIVDLAV